MAQFGLRSVLAMAAFAMLSNAGPLAAQVELKSSQDEDSKPIFCALTGTRVSRVEDCPAPQFKMCPTGQRIPAEQTCPEPLPKDHKLCPGGKSVPANQACPPPPITSRCPGKIVVPYGKQCPTLDGPPKNPSNLAKQASPKSNPGNWVPRSAYPNDALIAGIEGRVSFNLVVGTNGKPIECRVTTSSGNDSLDWAACESLMERATFSPATDKDGNAVVGVYSNSTRWVIGNGRKKEEIDPFFDTKMKGKPFLMSYTVVKIVGADGTLESCETKTIALVDGEEVSMPTSDEEKKEFCNGPSLPPLYGKDGLPKRTKSEIKMEFKAEIIPD